MLTTPTPEPTLPTLPEAVPEEAVTLVPGGASLPVAPMSKSARPVPLAVGQVLAGRFALERRLGAGGLAEVWAARDLHLGQDVAIKALHGHLASDGALCERFRRELAITRGLDHAGVVKVYDFYGDGGRPFFVLELLRGQSLAQRLAAGPVPREEALRIAREAAAALQAAHRLGVVHRDLKPHNLFLAEDPRDPNAPPRVVLLDFGLARAAGLSRMTATSTVLGTPGYIAPEVLAGQGCDGRADLYALGAVLFELLAGKRAFASVDPQAVLAQKTAPPRLEDALPGAAKADAALVARLLEADPERRFQSAGQVLRALGGAEVVPAPEAPPALTAGAFDVVVRRGFGLGFAAGRALERVRQRLGIAKPALGWRARLWLSGENKLVAGASQASAERVAALCREEGLGVQAVPAKAEGALARVAARALPLGLALAATRALTELAWSVSDVLRQLGWMRGAHLRTQTGTAETRRWFVEQAATWERIHSSGLAFAAWVVKALSLGWLVESVIFWGLLCGAAGLLVQRLAAPAPVGSAPGAARRPGLWQALLAAALVAGFLRLQETLVYPGLVEESFALFNFLGMPGHPWYEVLLPRTLHALVAGLGSPRWWSAREAWLPAAAALTGSVAALFAALRSEVKQPAPLPGGDPVVRRLAAGIERRLASLRAWAKQAPQAEQGVAQGMLSAAAEVALPVPALVEAAALAADRRAQAPSTEAVAAEREASDEQRREIAVERLLAIAAGLDDALAALTAPAADAARRDASAPLRRLREELAPVLAEQEDATPVDPLRRVRE